MGFFRSTKRTAPPPRPAPPALAIASFTKEHYRTGDVRAADKWRATLHAVLRTSAFLAPPWLITELLALYSGVPTGAQLAIGALYLVALVIFSDEADDRARTSAAARARASAAARARKEMLSELAPDPLAWPAWLLRSRYSLLSDQAQAAARPHLTPPQFDDLLKRAEDGGTVAEQIALVRGVPVPRIEAVTATAPAATHAPDVTSLRSRHHQLSVEYGTYLTDPVAVLRMPLLSDVTDPLTAELVESYALLSAVPERGDVDAVAYATLLERTWKAWRAARAHAEKVGLTSLDPSARKRVRRAQALLALVLDPSSTDAERAQAHTQAKKLLDGAIVLPEPTRLALDARVTRALTSGASRA